MPTDVGGIENYCIQELLIQVPAAANARRSRSIFRGDSGHGSRLIPIGISARKRSPFLAKPIRNRHLRRDQLARVATLRFLIGIWIDFHPGTLIDFTRICGHPNDQN